jgi:hypothetical protein
LIETSLSCVETPGKLNGDTPEVLVFGSAVQMRIHESSVRFR